MRLPKWVVKGVKDEFNVEALELKCKQQEEEIANLRRKINYMRFMSLPEDERRWIERALIIITWKFFPLKEEKDNFIDDYLKFLDDIDVIDCV